MSDDLVKRLVDWSEHDEGKINDARQEAADRIEALTAERDELQQVFDFQWRAHMRAVEMWRTANPGNDLVLPDSAKLTVWMLEQLEAARTDAKEAEAYAEELAGDQVDLCRQLIAAEDKLVKAVEALRKLHQAVCGETGFAACVRLDSGLAYPWPALDEADEMTRATLAEIEGGKDE
jgi:hypothetical protein